MSQELPVMQDMGTCWCGCAPDLEVPVLDSRPLPHALRHAAIFGALDSIKPGSTMILVASHDPLPLLAQAAKRYGDSVSVEYVKRGPEDWRLRLTRCA